MNTSFEIHNDEEMISVSPVQLLKMNNNNDNNNNESNFEIGGVSSSPPPIIRPPNNNNRKSNNYDEEEEREQPEYSAVKPFHGNAINNNNDEDSIETDADTTMQIISPSILDNNLDNSFCNSNNNHGLMQRNEETLMNTDDEEEESITNSNHQQQQQQQQPHQETAEDRRQREEEESLALAQQLMAEEAMASHRMSADFLRMNSDQFSEEDFAALQNALEEEEYEANEDAVAEAEDEDGNLSYDALLRLGERIGDVKADRWAMVADKEISKLEMFPYDPETLKAKKPGEIDDSEIKCLVCQYTYETGEQLRRLPCGHCYHKDCIDQWLKEKDVCVYCRQSICGKDHKGNDKKETTISE